ncbi:hypothetical protein [Rhizobium mongolense]|uniref:hypothetical protein n=1 Tax=Rhizobium mongolense TaxID=57676 RepID=UPI001F474822|nr:hypothetical protein [Rhizobium mongolense]
MPIWRFTSTGRCRLKPPRRRKFAGRNGDRHFTASGSTRSAGGPGANPDRRQPNAFGRFRTCGRFGKRDAIAASTVQALFSQQFQLLQSAKSDAVPAQPQMQPVVPAAPPTMPVQVAPVAIPTATSKPSQAGGEDASSSRRMKLLSSRLKEHGSGNVAGKETFIAELIDAYGPRTRDQRLRPTPIVVALPTAHSVRIPPEWKEMVSRSYVTVRKAPHLDIDGNEYIDLVNGLVQTAFGHAPDIVVQAVKDQAELGFCHRATNAVGR